MRAATQRGGSWGGDGLDEKGGQPNAKGAKVTRRTQKESPNFLEVLSRPFASFAKSLRPSRSGCPHPRFLRQGCYANKASANSRALNVSRSSSFSPTPMK